MQTVGKNINVAVKPIIQKSQHPPWSAPVNVDRPYAHATNLSVAAGGVASCPMGAWDYPENPTYAFAWRRGAAAIAGATNPTYAFVAADVGAIVTCQVISTNWKGA